VSGTQPPYLFFDSVRLADWDGPFALPGTGSEPF